MCWLLSRAFGGDRLAGLLLLERGLRGAGGILVGLRGIQNIVLDDGIIEEGLSDRACIVLAQAAIEHVAMPSLDVLQAMNGEHLSSGQHALGQRIGDAGMEEDIHDMSGWCTGGSELPLAARRDR